MGEATGGIRVHYEVLCLRGDRWLIDHVLPDRDAAVEEARRMLGRGDVAGVKVRKETFDSLRDLSFSGTIFRQLRPKRPRAPPCWTAPPSRDAAARPRPVPEAASEPARATADGGSPGRRPWPRPRRLTLAAAAALLTLLALATAVAG